jgi:hypothetical protein
MDVNRLGGSSVEGGRGVWCRWFSFLFVVLEKSSDIVTQFIVTPVCMSGSVRIAEQQQDTSCQTQHARTRILSMSGIGLLCLKQKLCAW